MGVVANIDYEHYPKQADASYKYPMVGKRARVCYKYDSSKTHKGTVVRYDIESPCEIIIKLDNGRYLRGVECQFSLLDEDAEKKTVQNGDLISRSELLKALEPFGDIKSSAFCRGIEIARKIIEEQSAACNKCDDDRK